MIKNRIANDNETHRINSKRIDKFEERQDKLDDLVSGIGTLANEQEHIKGDVTEIKTDVKALAKKSGEKAEGIIDKIVYTIVGLLAAYILMQIGIG